MHTIIVVAGNTFRETLRDKILYNLILFALVLIGSSVLLSTLTIGEQARIISDMGLASINLVVAVSAIFIGIGLVSKEIERRTIHTVLARPLTRVQFLLGKYLGLASIMGVNIGVMCGMFVVTLWLSGNVVHASLFQAIELILIEGLLIMAIAIFFSTFSSSILSATMTIGFYVIGHLTGDLKGMAEKSESETVEVVMTLLYYLCPNLEILNIKGQAASGVFMDLGYQATVTAYGLAYAGLLLTSACLIFQRRDF
jgi:Cu-processing system permease protein